MREIDAPFRPATLADAAALTELVQFASEGLAVCLWTQLAGLGGDPWHIGRNARGAKRAAFPIGCLVAELAGRPVCGLIGYPLGDEPEPVPDIQPAMLVPLHKLMSLALDTWYVPRSPPTPTTEAAATARRFSNG
jgi:hypothetical protein